MLKLTRCDAVRVESNQKNFQIIKGLVEEKIPVMGILVLLLNSRKNLKFKDLQNLGLQITRRALDIERAGAFSMRSRVHFTKCIKKILKVFLSQQSVLDHQILR